MNTEPDRLLLRGFPRWLTRQEKESLLRHFGATEVVLMPTRGKMRNSAFATFSSSEDAKRALGKLHQLQLFRSRLVVVYVEGTTNTPPTTETEREGGREGSQSPEPTPPPQPPDPPRPTPHPPSPPPRLRYHYPPPTPSTLTNITNALACVPKFYVQVLHVMNLMNLPPPFGPATPTPPLAQEGALRGSREEQEEDEEEEPESEIESDGETNTKMAHKRPRQRREVKHRAAHLQPSKGLPPQPKRKRKRQEEGEEEVESQFDPTPPLLPAKRIELHMPSEITPRTPDHTYTESRSITTIASLLTPPFPPPLLPSPPVVVKGGGGGEEGERRELFRGGGGGGGEGGGGGGVTEAVGEGKMEEEEEEEQEKDEEEEEKFIMTAELRRNRLTKNEMREMSVYRHYSPGVPSLRLYIKNLAKQVTEQDLRYIYGRYVNWSSEEERNIFDIRLMQTGRMKGQAFIGLPSEEAASAAVRETNGYQLSGRPMVVHFARTAKANPS